MLTLGLDGLTTYGLLRDTSEALTRRYLEALEEAGYLVTEPVHKTLRPTTQAGEVLFRGSKVFLTQRAAPAVFRPREEGLERSGQQPEDQELMAALKATRAPAGPAGGGPFVRDFFQCHVGGHGPPAGRRPWRNSCQCPVWARSRPGSMARPFWAVLARAEKEEV